MTYYSKKRQKEHENADNENSFLSAFADSIRATTELTASEWADLEYYLPQSSSFEHGRWRTSRFPFVKEILDTMSPVCKTEKVVLMKSAQTAGSEILNIITGFFSKYAPSPIIIAQPSIDMAKQYSKMRIDQMFEIVPALRGILKENRERDSGNTTLFKQFPGGYISLVGMNSAASARSKPARVLLIDEVDSAPYDVGGEGDIVDLLMARTRTYSNRKVYICSTPTIAGISRIEREFENSDQRFYNVPCISCGHYQRLVWKNIIFDKNDIQNTTRYKCENCGHLHSNHNKAEMLAKGKWVATKPSEVAGFHISALYSPVGFYSWENVVRDFTEATREKNQNKLKTVINTVFGETWRDSSTDVDWEKIWQRRERYDIGTVQSGVLLLVAGVDVQQDRLECHIIGYGRNLEAWSIDYVVLPGDTSDLETYKQLDILLSKEYPIVDSPDKKMMVSGLAIDSAFATATVYSWVRDKNPSKIFAVKGQASLKQIYSQPRIVDIRLNDGKRIPRGARVWSVGTDILKSELYSFLNAKRLDNGSYPYGYLHFPEYNEEFFKQLVSEQCIRKNQKNGGFSTEWVKKRDRNEVLDTTNYARACAAILGIDRYNNQHWNELEERKKSGSTSGNFGRNTVKHRRQISRGIQG